MGTWGAGVFENDSAGDYESAFNRFLVDIIQSGIYQMMLNNKEHPASEYRIIGAAYLLSIFYAELDSVPIEDANVPKQWKNDFFKYSAIKRKNFGQEPLNQGQYELFECVFDYIILYTETSERLLVTPGLDTPNLPISILWQQDFLHGSWYLQEEVLGKLRADIEMGLYHITQADNTSAFREAEFLAAIYICHMLYEKCNWYANMYASGVSASKVHQWHQLFYEWWEKYQGDNGKLDYLAEHRIVIHETFNNFQQFIEAQTQRWKTKKGN
jgi:hypothetical protein